MRLVRSGGRGEKVEHEKGLNCTWNSRKIVCTHIGLDVAAQCIEHGRYRIHARGEVANEAVEHLGAVFEEVAVASSRQVASCVAR